MALHIIILAAGQGKRMRSRRPKVLHQLAGKPLLRHVLETSLSLQPARLWVVYGHGGDQVRTQTQIETFAVNWVVQRERLGTGHAVRQALPEIPDDSMVLVLYGDVPLISVATLEPLVKAADKGALALLTARLSDPAGYGRIVRDDDGSVVAIVEHNDATEEQRKIREINTGVLACRAAPLKNWLGRLTNDNAQGEYYLTDVVGMAVSDGVPVAAVHPQDLDEILGVNDRVQLAYLERVYQQRTVRGLMQQGVTVVDPQRIDIRGSLECGADVTVDVDVLFEGDVHIGENTVVGPFTVIKDSVLGADVVIHSHCVIENAVIGDGAHIGPFARIRPGTGIDANCRIGNFVEVKNSQIGAGSKVNHLSYIGDSDVGVDTNIGAGTITCNYDGANKHRTVIGDRVFIGSDTQLVAPVRIGDGATIGAGSTITRDAPAGELTLSRCPQQTRPGWKRPVKRSDS